MSDDREPGLRRTPSALDLGVAAMVVVTLGLTHPVLELLGTHAEFFVARSEARADAWTFLIGVGVVVPLVAGVLVVVAALIARPLGWIALAVVATAAMFGLLGRTQVLPAIDGGARVAAIVAVAAVVAGLFVLALRRWPSVRQVVRWGAVVPLLSIGLFAFATPAARLLRSSTSLDDLANTPVGDPRPVVMLVFDELSVAGLMSGPDELNAELFPHLAGLARDGVWYRNATTVSDRTPAATPALLSGRYPNRAEVLPIAEDFPTNFFTLLADSHDVIAVEPVTDLCPPIVCGEEVAPSIPSGTRALFADVGVVAGHTLLPRALADDLPAIGHAWGGFTDEEGAGVGDGAPRGAGPDTLSRFVAALQGDRRNDLTDLLGSWDGDRPPAILGHSMLPHRPWTLFPSGLRYGQVPEAGLEGETWNGRDEVLDEARRRMTLQTGFVDSMVGGVLDDLRAAGLYDDALIIVTADHGIAIENGAQARTARKDTLGSIAAVPLIVRYPDGPRGVVDRRPVETVDIVATIVDVLDIRTDGHIDGRSLRDTAPRERARTIWATGGAFTYSPAAADPWPAARDLLQVVGTSWSEVLGSSRFSELVGQRVEDLEVLPHPVHSAAVRELGSYADVAPGTERPQAMVEARVAGRQLEGGHRYVAIVIDGLVTRVVPTFDRVDDSAAIQAVIAPEHLEPGPHDLQLFVVQDRKGETVLHQVALVEAE